MTTSPLKAITKKQKSTLQLKRPFGKTVLLSVVVLVFMTGAAEFLVRTAFLRSRLPVPSIGSGHRNLDLKLSFLNDFIKTHGSVDCIFLGSSFIFYGIDPEVVQQAYEEKTGKSMRSFNFGISGLSLPAAAVLAKILTKLYRPGLIVLGVLPGYEGVGRGAEQRITSNPWIQYHLGMRNFTGWVIDHSRAYRYYLRLLIWLDNPELSAKIDRLEMNMSLSGYAHGRSAKRKIRSNLTIRNKPKILEQMKNFKISPKHFSALEQILQFHTQVQIIIVEVPVHPVFFTFFERGVEDHQQIIAGTRDRAIHYGVPFLPTTHLNLIPDEGWLNFNHLNSAGAKIFSRWLGNTIGDVAGRTLAPDTAS